MKNKKYAFNFKNSRIIYNIKSYTPDEFPYYEKVIEYSVNFVKNSEFTSDFIKFIFESVSAVCRRKLIDYIFEGSIPKDADDHSSKLYHILTEDFTSCFRYTDEIVEEINSGRLRAGLDGAREIVTALLKQIYVNCKGMDNSRYNIKINEIKIIFKLDDTDVKLLEFLHCVYSNNFQWIDQLQSDYNFTEFMRFIAVATEIPLVKVRQCLNQKGRLFTRGIICSIETRGRAYFSLEDSIVQYLDGITDSSLIENYIKQDAKPVFLVDSFNVPPEKIKIISSLLSSNEPVNILLYGKAGTGKTEFARSLANETKKQVYFLDAGNYSNSNTKSNYNRRISALIVAEKSVKPDAGIIIVDEADSIINTDMHFFSSYESIEKAALNNFFDTMNAQIIWISNRVSYMEESTLRRFDYSVYFDKLSFLNRVNIWNSILSSHPLKKFITRDMINDFAKNYAVNSGGIASSLKVAESIILKEGVSEENVKSIIAECLNQHETLLTRGNNTGNKKNRMHSISGKYDVSAINTDIKPQYLLDSFKGFLSKKQNAGGKINSNINVLFYGLPGTGKTEFAKYLSVDTGLELVFKRYSDLESMWVGETEKNISSAFREAEDRNAILFIDEADSFFTARENANRSWEVSRTNEFLTQMENHNAIFICCTNLLYTMDNAAMRRFHFKVKFNPLENSAKILLYKKYFDFIEDGLEELDLFRLSAVNDLTPGDIKAVYERMKFAEGNGLAHLQVIEELEKESKFKRSDRTAKVGFGH